MKVTILDKPKEKELQLSDLSNGEAFIFVCNMYTTEHINFFKKNTSHNYSYYINTLGEMLTANKNTKVKRITIEEVIISLKE